MPRSDQEECRGHGCGEQPRENEAVARANACGAFVEFLHTILKGVLHSCAIFWSIVYTVLRYRIYDYHMYASMGHDDGTMNIDCRNGDGRYLDVVRRRISLPYANLD